MVTREMFSLGARVRVTMDGDSSSDISMALLAQEGVIGGGGGSSNRIMIVRAVNNKGKFD